MNIPDKNYDDFTEEEKKAYDDRNKYSDLALKIFNITFITFIVIYFGIYLCCKNEYGMTRYRADMNEMHAKHAAKKALEQKEREDLAIAEIESNQAEEESTHTTTPESN